MAIFINPDDSDRITDVLIEEIREISALIKEKINDGAIDVREPVKDFLQPSFTQAGWKKDWFQWAVDEFFNNVYSAISSAAHDGKLIKKGR